ncbi:RNAPII transcription regulator C-terminal-domain-containing protein [Dichotomocladium elegans]|nr:RNAPII transcription regulator C-terminal-domain-containing protein [Dichotomocladium elegans]
MADCTNIVRQLVIYALESNIQHTQQISIVKTIAALVNKSNDGWELIDLHMAQLNTEDPFAYHIATSFTTILQEDELILTKASFANTSALYKQRIFYHCIPKLMHRIETSSSGGIQFNHLCAFSYIITHLPISIISSESRKIIAGIIMSLQFLSDATLVTSLLRVTQQIVVPSAINNEIIPADHFRALIDTLLNLSSGHPASIVRVAALKCLGSFAAGTTSSTPPASGLTQPQLLLQSVSKQVVKQLVIALDDKKRHVRKEAVACRARWFALAG